MSFGYSSGRGTGTVSVPSDMRVLQISFQEGTMQIGDGDIFNNDDDDFEEHPQGYLVGPVDIVFTGARKYYVSWVGD